MAVVILAESLWQMLSWLILAVSNPTNQQEAAQTLTDTHREYMTHSNTQTNAFNKTILKRHTVSILKYSTEQDCRE